MQSVPTPMPVDKTPVERAQLKLIEQFAAVFLLNAAIAALTLYSSYASASAPNWTVFFTSATATGLLALFNGLEKYFSAKSEPLFSAMVEAGRQEVLARAPTVPFTTADLALQQSVNDALQPVNSNPVRIPTALILPPPVLPASQEQPKA